MRNMVLGFIGAKGLKGYYDSMKAIVEVSDRFHLPVEQVSAFANILAQFGGDADEAVQTVEQLQSLANNLRFHSSGAFRDLSAILNVNLQNKDFEGALKSLREVFKNLNDNAKSEVLRMMGTNSIALQRMLEADDEVLNSKKAKAEEMTRLTKDGADKIRDMDLAIAQLKANLIGIALPIIEALKPVLDVLADISEWFNGLSEDTRKAIIWGTIIGAVVTKLTGLVLKLATALKLLKIGSAISAVGKGAAAAGGVAATAASAATIGTIAVGAATVAGLGYLAYEGYKLENRQKNRTAEEKAYLNNQLYDMLGISNLTPEMSHIPIIQSPRMEDWVGRESKIPNKTTNNTNNDNRTMTFNIYGVDGATDLENRLSSIINNNVSPVTGWAK